MPKGSKLDLNYKKGNGGVSVLAPPENSLLGWFGQWIQAEKQPCPGSFKCLKCLEKAELMHVALTPVL